MIELIDVGVGNIGSVKRCLERLHIAYRLVQKPSHLSAEVPLLLPGVGAFGAVMQHLAQANLVDAITQAVRQGTPYLGICLGEQILFESSEEAPEVKGLGLLRGTVKRFQTPIFKIPQIGWNTLQAKQHGWPEGAVYFVNSFVAHPSDPSILLYEAEYDGPFCAAICQQHITGFQFHPEKSGRFGQQLLMYWANREGVPYEFS